VLLALRRLGHAVATLAILTYFVAPFFGAPWRPNERDLVVVSIIYTAFTGWIIGLEMRGKIKKDLGRNATDLDLTSIETWMKIDEIENPDVERSPSPSDKPPPNFG
jgi:hypothetical protein